MGRGPSISVEQQDECVRLRLEGYSAEEVGRRIGVNKSTVTRYWLRYLDSVAEDRKGSLERVRVERQLVHLRRARRARERQELEVLTYDHEGEQKLVTMDARGLASLMAEEARAETQIDKLLGLDKLTIEATVDISAHAAELQAVVRRGLELAAEHPAVTPEAVAAVLTGIARAARERDEA